MSINNNKQITNKSGPLVKEMQKRFREFVKTNADLFDEEDIKRIDEDEFFVKRFLLARKRNVDSAFKMMIETLKWIKRENFRRVEPNHFPSEFYTIGALFDYEPDLDGNFTIYLRVKYILRCGPMVPHAIKWASKFFYDLDVKLEGAFYTVLIDFQNCGLKNAEFEFIWHAINIMRTYLPACLKHILIIDLPKILKFGWIIVKKIVPESERSLLKFISRQQLTQFIDPKNIPEFLGGSCTRPYQGPPMVPKGCPTAIEYGLNQGVPLDQCMKVAKIYEPIIKEQNLYKMVDKDEDIVSRIENELKCRSEGKPLEKPSLTVDQPDQDSSQAILF